MKLKFSPPIAIEEGKGFGNPGELSSPPSDRSDYPVINPKLSTLVRQDLAISGSGTNIIEAHCNIVKGLPNLGYACLLNAILQILLPLNSLRRKILGPDLWI